MDLIVVRVPFFHGIDLSEDCASTALAQSIGKRMFWFPKNTRFWLIFHCASAVIFLAQKSPCVIATPVLLGAVCPRPVNSEQKSVDGGQVTLTTTRTFTGGMYDTQREEYTAAARDSRAETVSKFPQRAHGVVWNVLPSPLPNGCGHPFYGGQARLETVSADQPMGGPSSRSQFLDLVRNHAVTIHGRRRSPWPSLIASEGKGKSIASAITRTQRFACAPREEFPPLPASAGKGSG